MRHVPIAMLAFIVGIVVSGTSSHAAPGPGLTAPPSTVEGMLQEIQLFPRRYYRRNGPYAVPPVVVVPPAAVVVPPAVVDVPEAVVVLPPPRPASCGEYRYWNGQYCVDARYNRPYLGPRP